MLVSNEINIKGEGVPPKLLLVLKTVPLNQQVQRSIRWRLTLFFSSDATAF